MTHTLDNTQYTSHNTQKNNNSNNTQPTTTNEKHKEIAGSCSAASSFMVLRVHRNHITIQELCDSRGGRPGLSVLTNLTVSVDVKHCNIEPCSRTGLSLSLICQPTSEDIKQHNSSNHMVYHRDGGRMGQGMTAQAFPVLPVYTAPEL